MSSTIQTHLNKIKTAVYGVEVRDAIHDSIEECYDDVSSAKTRAEAAIVNADTAASNAQIKANAANSAASTANTAAAAANTAADNANDKANTVDAKVTVAETATKDANDAATKANLAATNADTAAESANAAAESANNKATLANNAATAANDAAKKATDATSDLESLKNDVTSAAQNANSNADYAKEKADEAISAVVNVESATKAANDAAESANAKASLADTAASAANTAASEANAARDSATTAAANVTSATEKANEAASAANTATSNANAAAKLANEKADLAEEKASEVESKGNLATSAAEKANTAAASANTAAENANDKATLLQEKLDATDSAAESANAAALNAEEKAASARAAATAANTATADARDAIDEVTEKTAAMESSLLTKVDDGYVENGYLYLTANGEVVVGPLGPFSGGGGVSGEGNNAVMTMTNTTGWLAKTVAAGSECKISLIWSSKEDGIYTGNGTLFLTVGGSLKLTKNVEQGTVEIDVKDYLTAGVNTVRIKMSDVYGNSRTMNFTVTAVEATIRSGFDASTPFTGAITYTYTPTGKVDKTVHFILDGAEIGTSVVSTSGRQQSYVIPAQTHGSHSLLVYYTAMIETEQIRSNELYYDLMCTAGGDTTPIIASPFRLTTVKQYESMTIPWTAYSPSSLTSEVTLKANGEVISTQTVGRTEQIWTYRADTEGELTLQIVCGDTAKTFTLTVTETQLDVSAEQNDLALYLSSYGRSNNEANPGTWNSGDVQTTFTNFNFASDGWQRDEDGVTVLRVANDARLEIGYQPFASDFRTTGKTIEIEFATRDVLNYDAVIADWMSGGCGIQITAQKAMLKSEQSEIGTQFKENEHVRVAFVVEKKNENRLIYIYINGIMTGATQYPEDDDFSQDTPVNISFGSNECTTDIYCIRVYDNDLTRYQVLDNWIADTQNIDDKLKQYERNHIFDEYGQIVIANLPRSLPYLILRAPSLPTYKGNKLTVTGEYTDPNSERQSFTFENATADVQGTSSAGYARKNYKIKFNDGFVIAGITVQGYGLRPEGIPTNTFTFKADVASSEGANNVELVRLYNDICPYKTPPQEIDPDVRQGIDGFPIVIFHDNGESTTFIGKYNFNNDKGTPEVFGFASGDESWEIRNNTSDRVLWKNADFSTDDWKNDFEARYPEDNTVVTNLSAFAKWLVSTDQSAATGNTLPTPARYEDVTYTTDTAAYRLAKFKAELSNYAEINSCLFYYLFTELFLMVDSRAKNAFPTKFSSGKFCWLPYDFDTAIGINNEGALAFSYHLEDVDQTESGADVYNGQNSVMWVNLRQAFFEEIKAMYQKLRSDGVLSYDIVEKAYEEHQSKWPEAVWNEDAYYKYLEPLIENGSGAYLSMLQGSKEEQRKWWLYNRFRYIDSKYNAGDSLSDIITLRGYAKSDITIEPYADIYASIKYGSYLQQTRALRGQSYTLPCPLSNVNDTEIYIYSASQIKSIGDLSGLKVGYAEFSLATKLQNLKLGDASSDYSNSNLTELYLGNNAMLKTLDVRNCPNLGTGEQKAIDLSGCKNLEHVYFDGTAIGSCSLPNGGVLKTLHLPETITNLTIRNQANLNDFTMPSYANITTLRLENVSSAVDSYAIFSAIKTGSRVRLIGIDWAADTIEAANALYDRLDSMRGIDENGNNTDKPQVSGKIMVDTLTGAELAALQARYPDITVLYNHITSYVYFYSHDGATLLDTQNTADGGSVTYGGSTPTRSSTAQYNYTFAGWSLTKNGSVNNDALMNVTADRNVYAAYTATVRKYTVYFYNGSTLLQTVNNVPYGGSATYTGDTPVSADGTAEDGYEFTGFVPTGSNITGTTSCYAQYTSPVTVAEITDDWDTIRRNVAADIYRDKYSVGNYKSLDLGDEGTVTMQIVAMNADETEDGSKAPITWVARELLKTSHVMNPSNSNNVEGTGSIGGWEKSEMRTYLNDTIKPLIPEETRKQIKPVKKESRGYDTSGSAIQNGTVDEIWIPSYREIFKSGDLETTGPMYSAVYSDNASRIKMKADATSATDWWLRSANRADLFRYVYSNGAWSGNFANYSYGVALGFSTGSDTIKDSWEEILAAMDDGSYKTKYAVGDTKLIDLGSEGVVCVTLVGIDTDDLADGSGKAKMSWITEELLKTSHRMNPSRSGDSTNGYVEGTGSIGGWEKSEMRSYMKETLKPLIPETVRNRIATVTKTQPAYDTTGASVTQTTQDDVWAPSYDELYSSIGLYHSVFPDNASRIKRKSGSTSATNWWSRSASYTNFFRYVSSDGDWFNYSADYSYGVALGFCLN